MDGENEDGESYKGVVCDSLIEASFSSLMKIRATYACKYDE